MISNFRKHIFVKFISVFISFVFLFTQLELKVFAQPFVPIANLPSVSLPQTSQLSPTVNITNITYAVIDGARIIGNGDTRTYTYNPTTLRLEHLVSRNAQGMGGETPPLQDLTYSFDPVGNITQITDTVHTNTQTFNYDALNRLTHSQGASYGTIDYTYDPIGNMIRKTHRPLNGAVGADRDLPVSDITYTVGPDPRNPRIHVGPHALRTSSDGFTYRYDANGNLIKRSNANNNNSWTNYNYDAQNRLISVQNKQEREPPRLIPVPPGTSRIFTKPAVKQRLLNNRRQLPQRHGLIKIKKLPQIPYRILSQTTFDYDPDGGRVKKTVNGESLIVNGQPQRQQTTTTYIGNLYEIETNKNTKYVFLGSERVCSLTLFTNDNSLSTNYYHTDHLGSSNLITNQAGELQQYLEYQPFGTTAKSEGSNITRHKFTGKELDDSTGLYFYSSRYYDASICRFIQPDTIVPDPNDPQSLNRYSYVRNNPLKYTDPTGHSFMDWLGKIFGFIAGAIAGVATGNFMVGFQVFNLVDSLYTAGKTGNWGGFGAGVAGGMIGGFVGGAAAGGLSNAFIQGGINFGEGFLIGAAEMGIAGFGSGFFGALGSGADAGDAARAGGISAGISAMAGGLLEGSYAAGWQDSVHFRDTRADEIKHYQDLKVNNADAAANYKSAVSYKHMKVELAYKNIPLANIADLGAANKGLDHWGIRITNDLDGVSGQWDFDWTGKERLSNWKMMLSGHPMPGIAGDASGKVFARFDIVGRGLESVTKVYSNIQNNSGPGTYILDKYDCRHWALEQLN